MAVTTTPTDLIEAAYAKSMKNNPGQIATETTELLQVVVRMLRKFYSIAARVNPLYFADTEVVAPTASGDGWTRPEGAESIFRIEKKKAGTPVYTADNTGDGVVTVTVGPDAVLGAYVLECTAEAGNGGTFKLTDPAGVIAAADVAVGTLHTTTGELNVLVADGAEDWDTGDIITITVTDQEVVVVPENDRGAESGLPAVYRKGKTFYAAGNTYDPVETALGDSLTFWYSKRPDDPASVDGVVDLSWEEAYNELVILEIALYLSNKDGRNEEMAQLASERDEWLRLFIMFLEHETSNERRRYGHLRRFNTQSLVPLNDLMIGGTTVKLDRGGN